MKTLLTIAAIASITGAYAQTKSDYDAAVNKFRSFYNNQQPDSIFNMMSEKSKGMMPLEKATQAFGTTMKQLGEISATEFTSLKDNVASYKTEFKKATLSLALSLSADNKLESFRLLPYHPDTAGAGETPVVLKTGTGNIYGVLTVPGGTAKIPVVLIIAGSGPTDRDGNNPITGKNNSYLMLTDSLKKAGIASLRYDKRGVGESVAAVKNEESVSFDVMINDAAGFIKILKQDPRFSKVIVLGHSEGSLIGMIAADKEHADAYISLAGSGERIDKTIERQINAQSEELGKKAKVILDSLLKGHLVKDIGPLKDLFRPSVQPYIISWLKYDPTVEIRKLAIPVMIIQGSTDIQVRKEDADLLKKANPYAALLLVKGMNHILKQAPEDRQQNIETYAMADLPLSKGLMPDIQKFITNISGK